MVFDWFKRAAVPQSPAATSPELPPEPPAASESAAVPAPEGIAPSDDSEPSLPASSGLDGADGSATPQPGSGSAGTEAATAVDQGPAVAPAPAVGVVDQEALDWARQAYARLKAQQEAARSAPVPQPIPSAALSKPPEAEAGVEPTTVAGQPTVAEPTAAADQQAGVASPAVVQQEPAAELPVPIQATAPASAEVAVPAALKATELSSVDSSSPVVADVTAVAEPTGFSQPPAVVEQARAVEPAASAEPTPAVEPAAVDEAEAAVAAVVAAPAATALQESAVVSVVPTPPLAAVALDPWASAAVQPPATRQEPERFSADLPVPAPGDTAPAAADPVVAAPAPEAVLAPQAPVARALSLLEQAAAERQQRLQQLTATAPVSEREPQPLAAPAPPALAESEPQLGAFDDTFTWSAEVLAAQGRKVDEMSLEEIDWLGRLRRGLEKTRRGFVTQLLENLGDDPLTPEVIDDLETSLLRADVGVQATDQVLEALRRRLNEEVVDPAEGLRFLKEQLRGLLEAPIAASAAPLLAPQKDRLNVWLLVGVNGVGKTTTLGKLANLAVRSGYSCLIAAADTFRAAAVEQVRIWGERSGVAVISNPSPNADPAAVVYDAIGAARAKGTELVLVDTAGRLQTKHNLMEELTKVRRIIDKLAPEAVVESLLVLDASQGQNGLRQAMAFASAAGLTGVVITKLDGSARGGVALAVASEAKLPIRFIGAGEGIRDLRPFNSFEFVEALLAS